MTLSDSMFLFEIIVEELKSFSKYKKFCISIQFADVFQLYLNDPNDSKTVCPNRLTKKIGKKSKVRGSKSKTDKTSLGSKVTVGQSVIFENNINLLRSNMKQYPLELSLCSKIHPEVAIGSALIPWSEAFIDYLSELNEQQMTPSVSVVGTYNVFDEFTSKCMATIKLNIKLSYIKDKLITQFKSRSEDVHKHHTSVNSSPITIMSTMGEEEYLRGDTGTIKTIYAGGKSKLKRSNYKKPKTNITAIKNKLIDNQDVHDVKKVIDMRMESIKNNGLVNDKIIGLVKSEIDVEAKKTVSLMRSQSSSLLEQGSRLNTLNYIFGDQRGPFGNQVYYVGYFTVQNDFANEPVSSRESIKGSKSSDKSEDVKEKFKFKICADDCPSKKASEFSPSHCSLDLPQDAAHLITVKKCDRVDCNSKKQREPPGPPDQRLFVDMSSTKRQCCDVTEKIEQIVGGMQAKMKVGNAPCYCSCECTFGFTKKTTYCNVCGGFELVGEEKLGQQTFPCPIFHKLVDKNKLKSVYSSGSDTKRKGDDSQRNVKGGSKGDKRSLGDKSGESEKDNKKGKKKKKDDRFKFNYGYQGIPPQIGHSQCAMPCTGTLGAVPKNMGWLWTADNIPGLKFRPMWKPGATNKHVVRLLKIARNPGQVMAKKRRRDGQKKKPLKRPLLVVHKKDGEFTVTMETMKTYTKPRAINQQPYDDKPLVTYTIGRSEEENCERLKKKERVQRRLEREQRDFIQSAFKDMCQEICLKTYQQALGILPDTEDPECTCYPAEPGPDRTNLNVSCSCSEDSASLASDTDSDEWILEFTPPNALFDPTHKGKKMLKADNGTQYTYLDYRVKLVDRYGNPVPRFFKGPDGKQQCSDLGGFWSPDHKWLEINVDGYIAPDNRWAPMNFIGPNGEQVDAETGKFQATNLKWFVVGVDGYVDCHGRWRAYPRPRSSPPQKKAQTKKADKKDDSKPVVPPSEAIWSCFGDATPKELSKMGIVGHGIDRKILIATLKEMLARGEDVAIPQPSVVPRRPDSKKGKKARIQNAFVKRNYFEDRTQCKHPVPSSKGILAVDTRGNKTYFRIKDYKNLRPKERMAGLNQQGISLSSFHVPCFNSFINSEIMKQQQRERLLALSGKNVATQAPKGWKPGAISKRLLCKLNKAKRQTSAVETSKPLKKLKKRSEAKPTLIVCKVNGEYRVEMQTAPENNEGSNEQYTPLVYKIAKADNKDRLAKLELKRRRLVKEIIGDFEDPYHPEVCEKTCLKAYKQAIGVLPFDPNRPDCTCSDEAVGWDSLKESCHCYYDDVSSDCSSMDIDWEIHFSPPIASHS